MKTLQAVLVSSSNQTISPLINKRLCGNTSGLNQPASPESSPIQSTPNPTFQVKAAPLLRAKVARSGLSPPFQRSQPSSPQEKLTAVSRASAKQATNCP